MPEMPHPGKYHGMPCSSAAAMTSLSRIEPPGWMTAVIRIRRPVIETIAEREEGVGTHRRAL